MRDYLINKQKNFKDALSQLERSSEKCLIVVDNKKKLEGTLTDGDIRRALLKKANLSTKIIQYIKKNPISLKEKNFQRIDENIKNKIKGLLFKIKDKNIDIIPIIDHKKIVRQIIFTKDFNKFLSPKKNLSNVPVLIMAGGQGNRLKPFSNYFPKPLLPVEDKTAAEHIIKNFERYGVKKFFMSIFYKKNLIKSYFKENNIKNLKFLEEDIPMGTAGAMSMLKGRIKNNFFLVNCDTLLSINLNKFYEFHKNNDFAITIVAASKNIKVPYGSCEIDKKGYLKRIVEKPTLNYLVSVGLYLIKSEVIKKIPTRKKFDMDELIKKVKLGKSKIGIFPISESNWIDTGVFKKEIN